MRISLFLSALLLGLVWNSAQPQSHLSEEMASRALLSAQTEQKDDLEPHRGSGRRRFREDVPSSISGESLFLTDTQQQV
ncbi:heterocyst-inhibiting protein PatX [Baaleninema sp.]|uniref:heterocyst-inhibiting protein PatX n=1 Tax=Baaleninema sp. TaxID=3101197 RepID=UPI003D065075